MPTITEDEGANVIASGDVPDEPCSSRQPDELLAMGIGTSEGPETDSLKTLQQIKSSQKKKMSRSCKWSREGRLNPLLPCGDDKGGYVFKEEVLELASFAKVFATGPEDPLENKYCFYCMLCRRNISMRMRGLYELKRHFQRDCHFQADQRFRLKHCPGKVRGRDGRVLYGSKWKWSGSCIWNWTLLIWILKGPSIMTYWRENLSHLQRMSLVCGSKSIC